MKSVVQSPINWSILRGVWWLESLLCVQALSIRLGMEESWNKTSCGAAGFEEITSNGFEVPL